MDYNEKICNKNNSFDDYQEINTLNQSIMSLTFTKEEIELMLYKLETKLKKILDNIKLQDSSYHFNEFVDIGYLRDKNIKMAIHIEQIDETYKNYSKIFDSYGNYNKLKKEGYEYSIQLYGFNSQDCISYSSNNLYVYDKEDIEKKAIKLLLNLI